MFGAVATTLSFSKAASSLGVSQSAISQAMTRLEARLDRSLFRRTTRNVELTPDGRVLRSYAAAMTRIADGTPRRRA